ncbi:MAG: SMI1/KNR4 family protein [Planctomycetota bacterium]
MKPVIKRLSKALTDTVDGGAAYDAISALGQHADKGDDDAKMKLAEYMLGGQVEHMRDSACSLLAEVVNESDSELAPRFEAGLSDESIRYWSILGYANTLGSQSYNRLTKLVRDKSLPVEDRAHAVKCLSTLSQQTFDRQLSDDPGEWQEGDIRLKEIVSWAKAGYPEGSGHVLPIRHPALDNPKTSLEKIVCKLDKQLSKKRGKNQDAANPSYWLAMADRKDVEKIVSRWKLPAIYVDFLIRFSPVRVTLANKRFWNGGLQLVGAAELMEAQQGYSVNPATKKAIRGWPKSYVVIGSHGGDPFVLDLKASDGQDAPVLTAEHGTGKWDFQEETQSFEEFLKSLVK